MNGRPERDELPIEDLLEQLARAGQPKPAFAPGDMPPEDMTRPALEPVRFDDDDEPDTDSWPLEDPTRLSRPTAPLSSPPPLGPTDAPTDVAPLPLQRERHSQAQPRPRRGLLTWLGIAAGLLLALILIAGSAAVWLYDADLLPAPAVGPVSVLLGDADAWPAASPAVGDAASVPAASATATARPTVTPFPTATLLPGETPIPPSPTRRPAAPDAAQPRVIGGVEMIYAPGGAFQMGDAANPPAHAVTLSPFYIDRTEVTNGMWAACVSEGACRPPSTPNDFLGSPYYGQPTFEDHPVIYVSWQQAADYCAWRGARLPTEAEWEFAARYQPGQEIGPAYPWGDAFAPERLNYCDASCASPNTVPPDTGFDDGYPLTAPVGSFPAGESALGTLDQAGNVAEWVADWFSADYYARSAEADPTGPPDGSQRVVRGGSWNFDAQAAFATQRTALEPGLTAAGIGLRCAADAE